MEPNPDLACGILTNIGELWLEEEFCDLTINIDDYQFRCHKFHLSANSAFFKTLLRSEKTDGSTNSISHVTIRGIDPEIFGLVLKAVYKGENCVDENNMIQMWHAAHELQIDVLVSKCEDFVIAHMTLDNYENIYQSSVLLESARVKDFAVEFMAKDFEKFRQTSLFLKIPSKALMNIVSSEHLMTDSIEHLVDSILMWANHNFEKNDESNDDTFVIKSDASADNIKKDKQCVEIMFSQPPVGLEDESSRRKLRQILQETERREVTLGKLLNLAKLEQTSPDFLNSLVDNDWLMGIKDARKLVWTARDKQRCAGAKTSVDEATPALESEITSSECESLFEDVFVYTLKGNNAAIAHNWKTDKRYPLSPGVGGTFRYLHCAYSTPPIIFKEGNAEMVQIGDTVLNVAGDILERATHPTLVGQFLYCFSTNSVYRTPHINDKQRSWYFVRDLSIEGDIIQTAVCGSDMILLIHRDEHTPHNNMYDGMYQRIVISKLCIVTFNTEDKSSKVIGSCQFEKRGDIRLYDSRMFFHNHLLFIKPSDRSFGSRLIMINLDCKTILTDFDQTQNSLDLPVEVYGVASSQNKLIMLANLNDGVLLPEVFADIPLRFVQAVPNGESYHVKIPKTQLVIEV